MFWHKTLSPIIINKRISFIYNEYTHVEERNWSLWETFNTLDTWMWQWYSNRFNVVSWYFILSNGQPSKPVTPGLESVIIERRYELIRATPTSLRAMVTLDGKKSASVGIKLIVNCLRSSDVTLRYAECLCTWY